MTYPRAKTSGIRKAAPWLSAVASSITCCAARAESDEAIATNTASSMETFLISSGVLSKLLNVVDLQQMGLRTFGNERSVSYLGSSKGKMLHTTEELPHNLVDLDKTGGLPGYAWTYCVFLHECIEKKSWAHGKQTHNQIIKDGYKLSLLLGNLLLQVYVSCGHVKDASKLFDTLHYRNTCTWAFLFGGYADQQHWEDVLTLFWRMWSGSLLPNSYIFAIVLQACAQLLSIADGQEVYSSLIKSGCKVNKAVASALIIMYTKCGCLFDAQLVFDEIPTRNIALWSAMLAGYANQGHSKDAIKLFWKMQNDDCIEPNETVCVSILKACAKTRAHNEGRKVHDCIVRNNFDLRLSVGNTLIDMYSKCGCLLDGRRVFENIEQPDFISWSVMLAGYGESRNSLESFKLFSMMESRGVHVNEITILNLLKGCESVEYLDNAMETHTHITSRGLSMNGCLENALVNVFAKCGALEDACYVFQKLSIRNVVSWSALITGHTYHGFYKEAFMLFNQMLKEGVRPNATIFVGILNVIAALQNVEAGKCVHSGVSEDGIETELFVGSSLVDMYAKCGYAKDAQHVFDCMPRHNIVACSSMMACYAQQEAPEQAIELFWLMQREGVKPDEITFVSILKVCTMWAMLEQGQHIHNYALDSETKKESFFLGSTLVDMYTRCGSLADARRVFDEIEQRDVALWNAMISGYGQYGFASDAFELLSQMAYQGVPRTDITFVGLLSACGHAGLLDEGLQVFDLSSLDSSISKTIEQCVCLVGLLGRAGCLHQAVTFAQEMPLQPDTTIWLSLVGVCRLNFDVELAIVGVRNLLEIEPENAVVLVLLANVICEAD